MRKNMYPLDQLSLSPPVIVRLDCPVAKTPEHKRLVLRLHFACKHNILKIGKLFIEPSWIYFPTFNPSSRHSSLIPYW